MAKGSSVSVTGRARARSCGLLAARALVALALGVVLAGCGNGQDPADAQAAGLSASTTSASAERKQSLAVPVAGAVTAKRAAEMFGSAAGLDNIDLDGDGQADLVWYSAATGETIAWLMKGNAIAGGGLILKDANFRVVGAGDFNGDGRSDLVWYNAATRQTVVWLMNGAAPIGGGALPNDPAFSIIGAPDLDGDGKADLLWYNPTTGQTYGWLMNGVTIKSDGNILVDRAFKIVAMPDLNGDGKADLVWYNAATGQSTAWLMNGLAQVSNAALLTHPSFKVVGTPDLDGDGRSDLVWGNDVSGENIGWLMDGGVLKGGGLLLADTRFKVIGTPDFNGDGKADLLWYNAATGETIAWLMSGAQLAGGGRLLLDPAYKVVGMSDLNGDGKADLQWFNAAAGQTLTWLMNGAALTGGGELLTHASFRLAALAPAVVAPPPSSFNVSGTVTGLAGSGLALQVRCSTAQSCGNGLRQLTVASNGAFNVGDFASGEPYAVSVLTQPASPDQTCTVSNGSGNASAAVNNIAVSCVSAPRFTIGATVSGLAGSGLVLQMNGGDPLSVSANGSVTFTSSVASGFAYSVTVRTQPGNPAQTCSVGNGSGTVSTAVSNIVVTCVADQRISISGVVSGLTGSGLVLQNGVDLLGIDKNGLFTFATALASGSAYNVTVLNQPSNPNQVCTVASGSGNAAANATPFRVTCAVTPNLNVGGTVTGLEGKGLVLQNNNGDNRPITADGAFTFATSLPSGSSYNVTVLTQPSGPAQTCTVVNGTGTGTVGSSNVSNVTVTCPAAPKQTQIFPDKNTVKIKTGQVLEMAVNVVNPPATAVPFSLSSAQRCATVSAEANKIVLVGRTSVVGDCSEDLTLTSGTASKTVRINLYDPATMHLGEGLLMKYVNNYAFAWWDSGSGGANSAVFWHPLDDTQSGWYPVGGYVRGNYDDIKTLKNVPMIMLKDQTAQQNLLVDPLRYEGQWDTSGMDSDVIYGSVYKPICPAGYVALGSVFWAQGVPPPGTVKCVAERFTVRGTRGAFVYNDADTDADQDLSVWKVGPPLQGVPDGKAAMTAGAMVGCPGTHDGNSCDPTLWNLLLVPMVVAEASDAAGKLPQLKGYFKLSTAELAAVGTTFSSRVRVPFTMITSEDPDCGTPACATAGSRVDANIRNSPFYYISREESYIDLGSTYNTSAVSTITLTTSTTIGWESSESTTFSQSVGLELGVEAKIYSAKLTVQLGWSQSSTQTASAERTRSETFTVQPNQFLQVLSVTTAFKATSEQGTVLPAVVDGTTTGTHTLVWPPGS